MSVHELLRTSATEKPTVLMHIEQPRCSESPVLSNKGCLHNLHYVRFARGIDQSIFHDSPPQIAVVTVLVTL